MNDDRMDDIPLVLETINEEIWAQEIQALYDLVEKQFFEGMIYVQSIKNSLRQFREKQNKSSI